MTTAYSFQNYNSIPAANYNINTANSSTTQLTNWNSTLRSASNLINSVSNGTVKTQFINPNGSIQLNLSSGSLFFDGVTVVGGKLNLNKLVVSNSDSSTIVTINGSISIDYTTLVINGNYTSLKFEANQKGTTPFGYTLYGNINDNNGVVSGTASLLEYYSKNTTTSQTIYNSYNLQNSTVGWDYLNTSFLLSDSTSVSNISSKTYDFNNNLIASSSYVNQKTISANIPSLYWLLMSGDDTIIASGDGDRIIATGYGGNDYIVGDSGDNYINNRVEIAKLIYTGQGNDSIDGGGGYDTVYMGSNKSIGSYSFQNYDATNNSFTIIDNSSIDNTGVDFLKSIEEIKFSDINLVVSNFRDYLNLISTSKPNIGVLQYGSSSSDSLPGSTKNDFIFGNAGNDTINAGTGDDCINGGAGNDSINGGDGFDYVVAAANIGNYVVTKTSSGYTLLDKTGAEGTDTLVNVEAIRFSDKTVNLTVQAKAASSPPADVTRLIELYTAFFNRVPDADGMGFWIDQMKSGMTVNQVASAFYNAGVSYSNLTGFSSTMTNADFINVIYKNVLGRKDGADAGGLLFWGNELASGRASRGSLVTSILDSAHTFKGNATWGWVADLLDNKIAVAKKFSIDMGLNYNTPEESISKGMAIASAITSSDTNAAIALIGVPEANLHIG